MNPKPLEKRINYLLLIRDYQRLNCFNQENKRVWNVLQSNLYQTDEILRWRSIEAIAIILRRRWDLGQQEKVLDYLRRLIWSMSDESGGIGWSSPQTVAEIAVVIPQLIDPFVNIMIDRSFHEPALIKSGLWGIGRLGRGIRPSIDIFQDIILDSFHQDDPETLGLASWALGEIEFEPSLPFLQQLKERLEPVQIYVSHSLIENPLGWWARESIARILHTSS